MGLKCPSCGFDSADGALYCDFCKQPFRKAASAAPRPAAAAAEAAPAAEASAADPLKKLTEGLPKEVAEKLPLALLQVAAAQDQPKAVEPWVRWAAWCFLGLWIFLGCAIGGMWLARYNAQQEQGGPGTTIVVEQR